MIMAKYALLIKIIEDYYIHLLLYQQTFKCKVKPISAINRAHQTRAAGYDE